MGENNIIKKVIDYIEDNLDGKLSLDDVAANAGYSKFHLNRLFSASVGCTLHKYIQTRRLTEAAGKLITTKKPIIEIAHETNYDSQQSFTLAFRQLYHCTPQRYRVVGIHTPKLNRFTIIRNSVPICKFSAKSEVMAA